jgi:hypothetical protein
MKSSIAKSVVMLCASFFSLSAHAGWSSWGGLSTLHTSNNPSKAFLYGMTIGDAGCSLSVPVMIMTGTQATDNAKEMYATALSAFMAGREVRVYASSCWTVNSSPLVTAIEVR